MTTSRALPIAYTTLSCQEIAAELIAIAREVETAFGTLDAAALNWRPDATRWSVAQCLEHLVTANALMLRSSTDALDASQPRTIWQRLPLLPKLWGTLLIRTQAPTASRKF